MSLLHSAEEGWIISHLQYLDKIYAEVENRNKSDKYFSLQFSRDLFNITSKFLRQNQFKNASDESSVSKCKTRKRKKYNLLPDDFLKEVKHVREIFSNFMESLEAKKIFSKPVESDNNKAALLMSRQCYSSQQIFDEVSIEGFDFNQVSSVSLINDEEFVLPENCEFFSTDVRKLDQIIPLKNQFDFILMDPPWWNKSIRRKKAKFIESSYKMMYNEELIKIPIGKLLSKNGLIAVWCTNSLSNLRCILEDMFPSWGVTFLAKWYWVKVTQSGDVVCDFNETHGKQPYELLIIGTSVSNPMTDIPGDKLIVSVPSAMHSHKPPLTEIIAPYLTQNPKCLEIFARYLLPNWTSLGFEVFKFQHISFFTQPSNSEEENKKAEIKE